MIGVESPAELLWWWIKACVFVLVVVCILLAILWNKID
jgi:hypothetical protein